MNRKTIRQVLKAHSKAIDEIYHEGMTPDDYSLTDIVEIIQDIIENPYEHRRFDYD